MRDYIIQFYSRKLAYSEDFILSCVDKCKELNNYQGLQQFIDIYRTNQIIKKVTLQKEEVSDYKFVTKDEFNKMINDNEIIPAIIDRYNMIKHYFSS